MKRFLNMFPLLLLFAMLIPMTGYASGAVTYQGDSDSFLFSPGMEHSPTSLFEDFQDVMPGDTRTEQIVIKNPTSNGVKIKVYLRSLGAQKETDAFLSQLKLTVQQKNGSPLFDAPADETAQLTDWVCLGTIYSGGEITLDVTLEVPVTLGDEFQNQVGLIDWEFKVDEFPPELSDPKPPQTGDSSNLFLYFVFLFVSLTALMILLAGKRKKQEETI